MNALDRLLERGLLPDLLIRMGIRFFLKKKIEYEARGGESLCAARKKSFLEMLKRSPIAVKTRAANEQHYEVPSEFFELVLGKRLKYSSGYWNESIKTLDASEEAMLMLSCERAGIQNGHRILELGCGWGSLSLFMAEVYPDSRIVAVSNSRTQKRWIDGKARERGLKNLEIITADMNDFETQETFDRIVSVEMLEHMRNYEMLFERISRWLTPDGFFWAHVFAHRRFAYPYLEEDPHDWIARYFFSGGIMPSKDLFSYFNGHLEIETQWEVNGLHYQKTCEAWLERMDRGRKSIMPLFEKTYGREAKKFWNYWRIFFMACSELFGCRKGTEWFVLHTLFRKKKT